MKKEEFISFLTDALDEMANKGYEEAKFDGFFSDSDLESELDSDDYPYDDYDEDVPERSMYESESSVFNTPSQGSQRRKADSVSDEFNEDLFKNLFSKFSPTKEVKEKVFNTRQSFENVSEEKNTVSFGSANNPFKMSYTRYEKPLEVPENLFVNSDGDMQSTLESFNTLLEYIMNEVERIYGGRDRITDIAVFSEVVIINKVSFEPLLKESMVETLPYDLQYSVRNGCFAYLFDFSYLRLYKNLSSFSVDDKAFLFSKVRLDLGKNTDFEPRDLFGICKQLSIIRVGEYEITRKDKNVHAEVFKTCRRSTEIADKLEDLGFRGVKKSWSCVRDIFRDKDSRLLWKGVKLTIMAGAATTVSVATAGFKLTRLVGSAGKSLAKGVGNIIDAVKDNR